MTYGLKFINDISELVLDDSSVKPWYVKDPDGIIPYGLNYKNVNVTDQYDWASLGQPKINGVTDTWVVFALYYLAPNNCVSVGTYTLPSSDSTGIWYATAGSESLYALTNRKTPGPMVIPSYLGGDREYIPSVGAPYPYFIIHAAVPSSWLSTATTEQINAAIPKVYFFGITEIPNADLGAGYLTNTNKYGVRLFRADGSCTYDSNKSHIRLENYSFPYIQTPNPPGTFGPDYNGLTVISQTLGMPTNANNATFQIPNIVQKSLTTNGSDQTIKVFKTFFKRTQTSKINTVNFAVSTVNNVIAPDLPQGTVYFNTGAESLDSSFGLGVFYYARLLVVDSTYLDLGYTPQGLPNSYSLAVYSADGTGIAYEEIDSAYGTTPNPIMSFVLNTSGVPNGTLVPYTISGTGITVSDIRYIYRSETSSSASTIVTTSLTGSFYVYNGVATVDLYFADDNVVEDTEIVTMTLNNGQGNVSMQLKEKQSFKLSYIADKLPKTQYSDDYQEGTNITVTLKSANIPNGTQLPYTISGTNITSSDIGNIPLTGNFTVNTGGGTISHGTATLTIPITSDNIIEGTETLTITVAGTNYYLPINTATFRIIDPTITYAILGPNGETAGPYSAINVTEGSTYTFSIQTTGIANGTRVYPRFDAPNTALWEDISASWFDKTTSTYTGVLVNNNAATFSFTIISDYLTEGTEYFNVYLDSAPGGPQVASWGQVNIQDTSTTLNEVLTITPSSVQYPSAMTVQITGGKPNSNVYYHTNAVATTADPFVTLDASGNYTNTNAGPSAAVGFNTLYLLFEFTGHTRSASWTVTAAPPTYAIAANVSSVNEGGTITYTVTTTNVANGTTLYWTNYGTSTSADFTSNSNTGSITINNNTASFTRTLVNDQTTEGSETDYLFLYTDAAYSNWTSAYVQVTINDTSLTPVVKTYAISSNTTSVNEGGTITYTVTTTNVPNNTYLYWINYGSTSAADFTSNSNSGSVLIYNNSGTFNRTLINDQTTEGSETDYIFLYSDSEYSNFVAYTGQVTVNDTSLTPVVTYNEINYISGPSTVTYPSGVDMYWSGGYPNGTVYYEVNNSNVTTSSTSFGLSGTGTGHNPTAGANLPAGSYTIYCLYAETGHRTSLSFTITAANPAAGTYLSQYCSGTTLVYRYANGSGGYYDQNYQTNSASCGYVAPSGPSTSGYSSTSNDNGNVVLYGSPSVTYDSIRCNGSGRDNIDMYVTRTFTLNQAATITAYLRTSSEANYDFGEMYFDNVQFARGSGNYDSGAVSGPISAGTHTVKCRYTKDGSVSGGSDYAIVEYSIS
jgi:hypothetical protein